MRPDDDYLFPYLVAALYGVYRLLVWNRRRRHVKRIERAIKVVGYGPDVRSR